MLHTLVFIFAEVFGNESFIAFFTVFIKGIGRICTPPLCDFAAMVVIKKIIMENNRVCCLYRVSTDKQVNYDNNNEADIPMQRKACHRFADKMGWTIVHEEQEDGVSGHKIRAENRDKIQAIKELARKGKFDILLVFMFDRIGRKLELVMNSKASETPIISSMGAGNKVSAAAFEVADIYETSVCPLARVMRYECRKRGIDSLKVVYSKEKPIRPLEDMSISCRKHCICPPGTARKCTQRRDIPGSTAFVPSAAGLIIAGEVIKDLIEFDRGER